MATSDITWNFEKFLIDHSGQPRYRFHPLVMPNSIKPYIEKLMSEVPAEIKRMEVERRENDVVYDLL